MPVDICTAMWVTGAGLLAMDAYLFKKIVVEGD